jgi:hypothetical protein
MDSFTNGIAMFDHKRITRSLCQNKVMRPVNPANCFCFDRIVYSRLRPLSRIFHRFVTIILDVSALSLPVVCGNRILVAGAMRIPLFASFSWPGQIVRSSDHHPTQSRQLTKTCHRHRERRMNLRPSVSGEGANSANAARRLLWNGIISSAKSLF